MTTPKTDQNKTTDQKKPASPNRPVEGESELSDEALESVAGGSCAKGEHYKKVTLTP